MTKTTTYTEVKEILGNNGFTLENAMDKSKDGKGIFDDLYTVEYNSTKVLYIRKNENDTFNTFELLNYPTSFSKNMNNVSLEKLIEILQSVVKNNFNEECKTVYKWEKESMEKYGEEITSQLIEQQKKHESQNQGNPCTGCGVNNQGAVIESKDGKPFLMHYGMWSYSEGVHRCNYCSKKTVSKVKKKIVEVNKNVNPTKKQIEVIESMIKCYGKTDNKEKTFGKLAWYDLASGIKNIEVTRKIMTDLKVI